MLRAPCVDGATPGPHAMREIPETFFTTVGDDHVAYQVCGDGPLDLVLTNGHWGHLDLEWDDPKYARFVKRLAGLGRVIRFNMRGSGLSDARPGNGKALVDVWAEDLLAVMNAANARPAVIIGWIDSGLLALPFAARYPDKVSALVLVNVTARFLMADDYPLGRSRESAERLVNFTRENWGTNRGTLALMPSLGEDCAALQALSRIYRAMAAPRFVAEGIENYLNLDVRGVLADVRAPTLVMTREGYGFAPSPHGRYIADHIRGARFLEIPGQDYGPWSETPDLIFGHIEAFITGEIKPRRYDRKLLAVLFTDIVDSTATAADVGDAQWRVLLDRHDRIQAEQIALFGGRLVDSSGDGTLAVFDRADQAIDCTHAIMVALGRVGISIRAGIHFGDVELREDERVGGLSVNVGARVAALAEKDEILVSHTVRDIHLGSGLSFASRGAHALKGVPGEWTLYAVGE